MKKEKVKKEKKKTNLWKDFKAFISRGSVLDMAVGIVIGAAFSAIVTAMVNILLSVCMWAVPGGLKGLVNVLPPANETQEGIAGIGQSFTDIQAATIAFAKSQNAIITADSTTYISWQNTLLTKYTLHGGTYYYNMASLVDWGTFINAVISFLIIAVVLFAIVKSVAYFTQKKKEAEAALQEKYYEKHPEERPVVVPAGAPAPTEAQLLTQIRDLLSEQNKAKEKQ